MLGDHTFGDHFSESLPPKEPNGTPLTEDEAAATPRNVEAQI
jgi:hypothetical protein